MSASPSYSRAPPEYSSASSSQTKKPTAPTYGATAPHDDVSKPLLPPQAGDGFEPRDAWNDTGDAEDDFSIGVTLSQSSQQVRHDFVRKVYSVLFCQILLTTVVGAAMTTEKVAAWTFQHRSLWFVSLIGTFASMFGVYFKATSSPANVFFLGAFTVFEAISIGYILPLYNPDTVLKALVLTTFIFLGLTLFTLQTKYDILSWYPYLMGSLIGFFALSVIGIFFPFGSTTDLIFAGFGCLLFSAWIVFDTHMLLKYLHVDQWALACVSLYLDILNLFLQILRVLSDIQDR
ncbi:Bxi1p [Sporobolomyces koalae]|uniref:Bxi1p n=1 Tax=Sporobolomyces koalae TaxID=500713 RepID=UPI00317CED12